jgi:hypothetical protein
MTDAIRHVPALAAILLASTMLGGCFSTSTYGTGQSPEVAVFKELTGNVGGKKKAPIEYQARAPLVMPPSGELRQPVQTASVSNPQWPDDPDKRVAGEKISGLDNSRDELTPEYVASLKPLSELSNANPNRGSRNPSSSKGDNFQPAYDIVGKGGSQAKEFNAALQEAEGYDASRRKYLTEPPLEARAPAPTAPTQFDDIKKKRGNFLTKWFTGG